MRPIGTMLLVAAFFVATLSPQEPVTAARAVAALLLAAAITAVRSLVDRWKKAS